MGLCLNSISHSICKLLRTKMADRELGEDPDLPKPY